MKLLIDLGNTRLKWSTLARGALQPGGVFAHARARLGPLLRDEWGAMRGVEAVFVASVVAAAIEAPLAAWIQQRFGQRAQFLRSPKAALGIRNAYEQPERLGIDRFLALAALQAAAPRGQVLVSVGTALTVDALAADGRHAGGVIVPSPHLMREAVLGRTAHVTAAGGGWREMPANTADGVVSGTLYAAAGAVDRFVASATRELGEAPALVLTGGGADELAPLLPGAERASNLVLQGLALWAREHDGAGRSDGHPPPREPTTRTGR